MKLLKVIDIVPVREPRMTRRDKYAPSAAAQRYYDYANELRLLMSQSELPDNYLIVFYLPMPKSWSKKKKARFYLTPHQQTPDKDNLEKAFLDSLFSKYSIDNNNKKNDSHVWDGRCIKLWGNQGAIAIYEIPSVLDLLECPG